MIDTYAALVGLVLGSISPPVIAIIQQPHWSTRTRFWVAVTCATGIGAATAFATGQIGHGLTLPATIAAVFVATQATYKGWRDGGVLDPIERSTSR